MQLNVKIFNLNQVVDVARDWNITAESSDLATVLRQPYRIACVPAMFNRPNNFCFSKELCHIDLGNFDLVVISDIEQERTRDLTQWIEQCGIKNHVLAQGARYDTEGINASTTVVRSWWMQNLMRMNTFESTASDTKSHWFDVLLGARRPHRDFVMLSMQKHTRLLENSVVSYRDAFHTGQVIDEQTHHIHAYFPEHKLQWPYVSPNLDPDWEVKPHVEKSISPYVPWNIYRHTWYSAVCETSFTGNGFFLTEKTTKALFAQRVFVMFAPCQFLARLKESGFETFGSVIDESYDDELVDLVRYRQAFSQMLSLVQQDPVLVYKKLQPLLKHNYHRLWDLQKETQQRQQQLLLEHIPTRYIIN